LVFLFLKGDGRRLDGYCSTVQGLLDWFEIDLGFPEPFLLRLICVLSVFLFLKGDGRWQNIGSFGGT